MPVRESDRYTPAMPGPLTPPVARLLELVEADGRTRNEIAAAAGMSPAQLSQVLTGHRADPSITTVGRILAAVGKSWSDLDPPSEKPRGKRRPRPV
jgi:transcriptional regulator with XRE-family HTH domain